MEILNVENLTFTYPKCDAPVIKDVNFSIYEGEFVILCGATGSGKSTLLKALKPEITPIGEKTGIVHSISNRIGYVGQNPKEQAVTDKVWHELAFGLENMNVPVEEMRIKVAEMASYFGIEDWFDKKVAELSGGQLQLLNLASVMVMNPDILILDEPSAQLDPVSASEFFTTLKKLNEDFSLTIIIAEHRLEELVPYCDRMIVLKDGKLLLNGGPKEVLGKIEKDDEIFEALPSAYRLYRNLNEADKSVIHKSALQSEIPITIKEGRDYLRKIFFGNNPENIGGQESKKSIGRKNIPALEFSDISFRFYKEAPDALKDISFSVNKGEIFCFLGGNGSGKTTALNVAAGLLKPYEGTVRVFGKKLKEYKNQSLYNKCLSMLPQDVQTIFLHNSVREELEKRNAIKVLDKLFERISGEKSKSGYDIKEIFGLEKLLDKHPYDLSGGEQQLLALSIVLATEPKLILLDEPTKGLDAYRKKNLARILKELKKTGITIVMVTHDVEFAAVCADRCALLFRGNLTAKSDVIRFLSNNNFYTTSISRMTKGICDGAVTVEGLTERIKDNEK